MKTLITFFLFASAAYAQTPVKIFIKAKASNSGFVEGSRVLDSVKDLQGAMSKSKVLRVMESEEDAQLILEVVSSGIVRVTPSTETKIERGILGTPKAMTVQKEQTLPQMATLLHVKGSDYTKEFSITQQLFWKDMAKRIAEAVEDWAKVNGQQIPKP